MRVRARLVMRVAAVVGMMAGAVVADDFAPPRSQPAARAATPSRAVPRDAAESSDWQMPTPLAPPSRSRITPSRRNGSSAVVQTSAEADAVPAPRTYSPLTRGVPPPSRPMASKPVITPTAGTADESRTSARTSPSSNARSAPAERTPQAPASRTSEATNPRAFSAPAQTPLPARPVPPLTRIAQQPVLEGPGRSLPPPPPAPGNATDTPPPESTPIRPQLRIPLVGPPDPQQIELLPDDNGRISLIVRDAPLNEVLAVLALRQGVNIVTAEDVTVRISVTLRDVTLEDALTSLTSVGGYTWSSQSGIIQVTSLAGVNKVAPQAQGRIVQVFNLNYISGSDVETVARGLLSPVGQLFTTLSSEKDNRKTRDVVVVEDLPQFVARVADYIAQVDHPPRQVLIEAHVLEVTLSDDTRFGVNWETLARVDDSRLRLRALPFTAGNPLLAPIFTIDGHDLDVVVEAIKATTDSKMLAQPRLLVVNGQQARLQIGRKFGYLVTTTTQTSTLQNVEFLNVGVLLTVKPQITDEGHVLLSVRPEVSGGGLNPVTNLPETTTTEVETNVMLADGQGIVIGGLIRDTDEDRQSKIPYLGDLWMVGRLFQRRTTLRERKEVVVALIPRIVPYSPEYAAIDATRFRRATTPILEGPLKPVNRPWEAKLPDAMLNPRRWRLDRCGDFFRNLPDSTPLPVEHYFPAPSDEMPWTDMLTEEPFVEPEFPIPDVPPPPVGRSTRSTIVPVGSETAVPTPAPPPTKNRSLFRPTPKTTAAKPHEVRRAQ